MSLKEYNKKRNFDNTSEPKGKIKKSSGKKFVIQFHQARAKHYDFRLQHNGVLVSFAIPKGLSLDVNEKRLAVKVEDHPLDYIDFEGIIPKGNYGAGTVKIHDSGEYFPLNDLEKGLKDGHIKIILNGKKYKGGYSLIRIDDKNWIIKKANDEYAKTVNLPFKEIKPQLATLALKIPQGKEWIYEIKYDGYRMICYVKNKKIKIVSRNNNDYTDKLKSIVESLKSIEYDNFIIDGELVVFDNKGRSDFSLLSNSLKQNQNDIYYIVFDLLALNGEDLRNLPLIKRKEKLEKILSNANNHLIYSKHVKDGNKSFKFAIENNLEGIIAKNINSKYVGNRSTDWLKIKCYLRQEFIIAGYKVSDKNELISSLILAYYKDKELKYAGKVGTGLTNKDKEELHELFKKYQRKTSPFKDKIKDKDVFYLKPTLVAEIKYIELTKDKILRQPSFIALRKDKEAKDIVLEDNR